MAIQRDEFVIVSSRSTLWAIGPGAALHWEAQNPKLGNIIELAASPVTGELHVEASESPLCEGRAMCLVGTSRYVLSAVGQAPSFHGTNSDACSVGPRRHDFRGRPMHSFACGFREGSVLQVAAAATARAWSLPFGEFGQPGQPGLPASLTGYDFDPAGNILVSVVAHGRFDFLGRPVGRDGGDTPLVLAYTPEGQPRWAYQPPEALGITGPIATAADGSMRVLVWTRSPIPGAPLPPDGQERWYLLSLDSGGTLQWARLLPEYPLSRLLLTVSAEGRTVVGGYLAGQDAGQLVLLYQPDGAFRGWHRLQPRSPWSGVELAGLDFVKGTLVLGGRFRALVDLGFGPFANPEAAPDAWDGFIFGYPW
jgi:hypothetical protein